MDMHKDDFSVLYVEDEADIREGVAEMLRRSIPRLYLAENGRKGLDAYQKYQPEIIITDIRMPEMDGLTMSRQIKSLNKNSQIIITSAHSDTSYLVSSIELGINQYVFKPVSKKKLFDAIERCLEIVRLNKAVHTAYKELEARVIQRTSELTDANEQLRHEISERIQAQTALQEAHQQTEDMLASISSMLIVLTPDDTIAQWNTAAEKTFGIKAESVLGKNFSECAVDWQWDEFNNHYMACKQQQNMVKIPYLSYVREDARKGLLSLTMNPILNSDQKVIGYALLGADVTERKNMEIRLSLARKMESIGQMAAGVAHEINTPMQYIGDNIRFLRNCFQNIIKYMETVNGIVREPDRVQRDDDRKIENLWKELDIEYILGEIPRSCDQSLEGVDRVTRIVRALKNFSHPSRGERTLADINAAIDQTAVISKNEWKYCADLEIDPDLHLPPVQCVIDEINQVLLNMVLNAAHAVKDVYERTKGVRGKITVQTRHDDKNAYIVISDTGTGIDPENIDRIFDPFFTTKGVGQGTGQGLYLAHDIVVNKHNGRIEVSSVEGKGTTFTIVLPLADAVK